MWFLIPSVLWSFQRRSFSTRDTVTAYREYKQVLQNIVDAEEMIKESGGDADLEEMAKQELKDTKGEKEEYEEKLKILLYPKIQMMIKHYP